MKPLAGRHAMTSSERGCLTPAELDARPDEVLQSRVDAANTRQQGMYPHVVIRRTDPRTGETYLEVTCGRKEIQVKVYDNNQIPVLFRCPACDRKLSNRHGTYEPTLRGHVHETTPPPLAGANHT